ncbi:preQ(1) synthase [Candidatus Peregrinibacteria bacterium CG_4_10_14_0_2_um_filter_43_11]|nr:MAG: preQ(1) synthase [Candidatus Peregrinibacteria bacterium CG_4_10_14_0_2_um_filter_43_11]
MNIGGKPNTTPMSSQKIYQEGSDYKQENLKKLRTKLKKEAPLETFAFTEISPGEHWVTIESPEFTAICPFSNYPDFGTVTITYIPDKVCLELKSFKLYINAFREVKIFHEHVTEVIFADFMEVVKPKKANITVDMNVRGNVKTVCEKFYKG